MADVDETVLAVNEQNEVLETVSRDEAHEGEGIRHRAYTVLVRDGNGRVLLARRSDDKMLWPGYWDGTVASHPSRDGPLKDEALERLETELGIQPDQCEAIREAGEFEYKAYFEDVGVEWEVCSLLLVRLRNLDLRPDPREVSDVQWEPLGQSLRKRLKNYSLLSCPWFQIALDRVLEGKERSNSE